MINFCTLFDSNYLSRGLALYESLNTHCDDFHIFIFAFDDSGQKILNSLRLEHATIIGLDEFEDEKLLAVKQSRSYVEYCWTCTPSIIKFVLDNYAVESCTYLDADIYFWRSPTELFEEMGEKSVLIVSHRYTPRYDHSRQSGTYCVQFMPFKNDRNGKTVLEWWRNACIDWCYARHENGKFGDQKYLDDWPQKFTGVHVLNHLGGGVAPWNIQQYEILKQKEVLSGKEIRSGKEFDIVFYHFHHLRFYGNKVDLGGYRLSREVRELIYIPYIKHLEGIRLKLETKDNTLNAHGGRRLTLMEVKNALRHIKHSLMSNVLNIEDIRSETYA